MNSNGIKNTILIVLSAVGGFFAQLMGGWDAALQVLIICMAVDYITGMIVAGVFRHSRKTDSGALDSRAGFKGLMRKVAVLLVVLIAAQLDTVIGGTFSRTAVILFFCANESLSVLENVGLMGVEYPKFLKNALEALKDKGDNDAKPTD
jgi:toxin secretion/phage lysis holin